MKRTDFPSPFSTCLIDLNADSAYIAEGKTPRCYPRLQPVPYSAIAADSATLLLEPWRKNLTLYPQLYFLVSRDVEAKAEGEDFSSAVLGVGMGLAFSDDGIEKASKDPAVRDRFMCYWYSLYSDNSQVLAEELVPGINARELKITIESATIGKQVFDQGELLFDPADTLREMNVLMAYRKYDLFSLGAAGAPIHLPVDRPFAKGEVITLSCPELGTHRIMVDDRRDPNVILPGWSPRPYFLDPDYCR